MPLATLDYLLSKKGINQFSTWYNQLSILEPLSNELDNYTLMLNSTRWLDNTSRENIRISIREYLELFITLTYKKTAKEIFQEWIDSIKEFCFQGGYGYAIFYPDAPHHWVIKPEYYAQVVNIPENVILAACVSNKYIEISTSADWEKWC